MDLIIFCCLGEVDVKLPSDHIGRGLTPCCLFVFVSTFVAFSTNALDIASQSRLTNRAAAGNSFVESFSRDGHVLVFLSEANNLVTNDNSAPYLDIFSRDILSGRTTLLSVSSSGVGGGNGNSIAPSVSENGHFIAFQSAASNLVADDTNSFDDVFVRDSGSATTTVVSRNFSNTGNGNGASRNPRISANGRYVLFDSVANNLITNDLNQTNDVFVRDLQLHTTSLVSVNSNGNSANGPSSVASLTPDGRFALFISSATDVVSGATNGASDVFVRDLLQNQTIWVSFSVKALLGNAVYRCFGPTISDDGRIVGFKAAQLTESKASVFRIDLSTGTTALVTQDSIQTTSPHLTSDGRYLAYENGTSINIWDAVLQPTAYRSKTPSASLRFKHL
jgi:Tol biopolymer transport system component